MNILTKGLMGGSEEGRGSCTGGSEREEKVGNGSWRFLIRISGEVIGKEEVTRGGWSYLGGEFGEWDFCEGVCVWF